MYSVGLHQMAFAATDIPSRRGRLPHLANPVTNAACDRKQSVNTRNPQFVPHAPHVGSRRERPSATQLQSEKMGVRTRKMAEAYGQLTSRKCEKKRDSQRSRPNRRTPVRLSQRQNSTKYDTSPSSSSSSPRSMYCHDDRDSSSRRGGPIAKALREVTNSRILTRPHRLSCRRMTGSKALYGPHRSSKRLNSTVVTIAESSGTSGRDVSSGGSGSFNSTKRSRCAGRYNSKRKSSSSANSVNRANRPSQHPVTVRRVQGSGGNLCCKTISILQRLCVARRQAHNSRGRAGHGVVLRDSMKSYFF
ncbi:unnamed protein product [Trypanosoma congolense IL3000]|uniref:WGS project CAEQ00000000 data, annotated contig 1751 n=1 Tax=Trypanosoma congolense (strain IL3000) TaxID=1068625 RepID=F9W8N1_TRYCI|nr:unnamed protein product [Trypanosoma congolense IL3000]